MRLFHTFGCLLLAANLLAVPARRCTFQARMTDGTIENITFCGDENRSFYLSEDGYVVEKSADGNGFAKTAKRPADLLPRALLAQTRSGIGSAEDAPIKPIGSPKIPVILVNFSDAKMTVADTDDGIRDYYDKYCNGTRDGVLYSGAGSMGAVRDYFAQQSDSVFMPEFEIVGPVTLSRPLAYYGENSVSATDVNFSDFCEEALQLATALRPDFADVFDNDGNGTVDLAFFIYAGLPESECLGGMPETIWPKEWVRPTEVNGVTVSVLACTSELSVTSAEAGDDGEVIIHETEPAGIGTMCHEVAHSLGFPDEYDTNGLALGMSYWSLMDSGNYCYNGKVPCGLTAYERDFLGWRPLETLEASATVRLRPLEAGGSACKVVNPEHEDEYYVLENRQAVGWDSGLRNLGHGMLVVHVDYDAAAWTSNSLNTEADHQRMSFIPANNLYVGPNNATSSAELLNALRGQPYPGITGNVSLTDETVPAAEVFHGAGLMGQPITQVSEQDNGDIVFKFMPKGQLAAPAALTTDEVTSGGFRLMWEGSEHASCYGVQVYGVSADGVMTDEPVFRADSVVALSCDVALDGDASLSDSYACSVAAMDDEWEDSPWSDYCFVRLSGSAIQSVEAADASDGAIEIYSLHGVLMGRSRQALEYLPAGVYVVRAAGRATKVIVK